MEGKNAFWFLENIDLSGIFCPKKFGAREAEFIHKTYKKGEFIYIPDSEADLLFYITKGRVKIGTYGEGGKEIIKAVIHKGEVFGELVLVGEEKRRDFAQALEPTTLCALSKRDLPTLLRDRNELQIFLLKVMGSRVLEMEKRLESLVFKDSRTRVIEFLVDLAEKKGERVGYETVVRKFFTHQEIANLTATSRQTVTTVLNDLRSRNILIFDRKRLLIRDLDLLRKEIESSVPE